MPHLALVAKAQQSLREDDPSAAATPPSRIRNDNDSSNSSHNNNTDSSNSLTAIYESYAALYPNPRLMLEVRERHALLTAAAAAQEEGKRRSNDSGAATATTSKQRRGGLFGFLFGKGKDREKDDALSSSKGDGPANMSLSDAMDEDDRFEFGDFITSDLDDSDNNKNSNVDRFPLCGTQHAVDDGCIPLEAHALARFHLASTTRGAGSAAAGNAAADSDSSTGGGHRPNVATNAWERPGSTLLVVVGLGQLIEFPHGTTTTTTATANSSNDNGGGGMIQYTSDAEDLKDYCALAAQCHSFQFQVAHARAAMIGPNLCIVSWGLPDGTVILYRRLDIVASSTNPKGNGDGDDGGGGGVISWQAVACCQPTPVVQHNLGDVFAQEEPEHPPGQQQPKDATNTTGTIGNSALLIATDVLPIVVELGQQIPAATLAIARLGGFIELVPLPPRIWYGDKIKPPVADSASTYSAQKQQQYRQQRAARRQKLLQRQKGGVGSVVPHYAAKLVDIANTNTNGTTPTKKKSSKQPSNSHNNNNKTKVVSTLEYHVDVIGLAAFRTRVDVEGTSWDREKYPSTPPAEHVLCAFGSFQGRERLTFWSVSTLFTTSTSPDNKNDKMMNDDNIGFALHVVLSEAIDVGPLGPDISIFATRNILQHWRKPRHVQLRNTCITATTTAPADSTAATTTVPAQQEQEARRKNPIATISVSMPIVSLRVSVSNQAAVLAALDCNGGVTILDCALLERTVSQSLSDEEYAMLYQQQQQQKPTTQGADEEENVPPALVTTIFERSHLAKALTFAERQDDEQKKRLLLPPCILDIQYLSPRLSSAMAGGSVVAAGGGGATADAAAAAGPVLAVLTEKRLHLMTPTAVNLGKSHLSSAVATASSQLHGTTAAMHLLLREGLVLVVKQHGQHQQQEGQRNQLLNVWNVQQLDPSDIVQSLVHEEKFQEAVDAAMKLGQADQARLVDTIQTCRKRLWEAHRSDFDCLAAVSDDLYIVEEALAVSAGQVEIMCNTPTTCQQEMDFCRSVLLLALGRLSNVRLGPMAGLEGTGAVQSQVRDRFIKLGTYEILCQLMDIEPSIRHFGDSFLDASVVELALCFARAADIAGLSVVYFRHHREVLASDVLVVDEIPVPVPPSEYQHLLPIAVSAGHDGGLFLSGCDADQMLREWSLMPQYVEDHFGFSVSIDKEDTRITVEATALGALDNVIQDVLPEFYMKRARSIQAFSGSLEHAIVFSMLALAALGASCSRSTSDYFRGVIDRAEALKKILLQSGTDVAPPALITLTLEDLGGMEILSLIAMVLEGQSDSVEVFSRFRCYIQPLLPYVAGGSDDALVGDAISSYCSNLLQDNLVPLRNADQGKKFLRALDVCSAILSLSRTSMPVRSRLIKNRAALLELVLRIFSQVSNHVGRLGLTPTQHRHALDSLWTMYESLPLQLPKNEKEEPELDGLMKRANEMFRLLVAADILFGWPGCVDSFDFLKERLNDTNRSIDIVDCTDLLVDLCRSFCKQVCFSEPAAEVYERSELFSSLLSDISELNRVSHGKLPVDALLAEKLFEPLLRQRQIGLLDELLSSSHAPSMNKELAAKAILSFINDVVFSEGAHEDIPTAIACGDRLGRYFPELQQDLAETRNFVHAAHFINSVLVANSEAPMSPQYIRNGNPIDIVESVLDQSPDAITCDCEQWADEYYAMDANKSIRHFYSTHGQRPDQETVPYELTSLPTLPALAVYHLAALLGLRDGAAVVAVKSRVVHHAVGSGFFGAAAAICRTMLLDEFKSNCESQQVAVLDSTAKVVTHPTYGDIQTKKELSSLVLSKFRGSTSAENSGAFDQILAFFCSSECVLPEEDQTAIPISSIDRLCQDTLRGYSIDLRGLFSELHRQTAEGLIDDSLLKALSRHSLFWSIADSTRPKDYLPTLFEQDDAFVARSLGSTLLMHIQDREMAEACLHEIQAILSEQSANAERFASNDDELLPRADIVRQLVGRGYSEFGARRSVWMSGNRGFDPALQWAIGHSHEQDFDHPMVLLKRKGSHVDMIGVRRLEATLELSGRLLSGRLDPSVLSLPQNSGSAAGLPASITPQPAETRIAKSLSTETVLTEPTIMKMKPAAKAPVAVNNCGPAISAASSRTTASIDSSSAEPISNGKDRAINSAILTPIEKTAQAPAVVTRSQVPASNGIAARTGAKLVVVASPLSPTRPPSKAKAGESRIPRPPASQLMEKTQADSKPSVEFSPAAQFPASIYKSGTGTDGKHRASKLVIPASRLHASPNNAATTTAGSTLSVSHASIHGSCKGSPTESKLASAGRALFTSLKTQAADQEHRNMTAATASGVVSNSHLPPPPPPSSKPHEMASLDKALVESTVSAVGSKATTTGMTSPDLQRLAETRARARALGAKPRPLASSTAIPITRPRLDLSNVIKAKNSTPPEAPRSAPLLIDLLAGRKSASPPVPAPPSSGDRLSLREQGKAALDAARNACTPEGDERRRLIEEGRRLLLKARHDQEKSPASLPAKSLDQMFATQPATSTVPPPPPPHPHHLQQQLQRTIPPPTKRHQSPFSSPKHQPPPPPAPKQEQTPPPPLPTQQAVPPSSCSSHIPLPPSKLTAAIPPANETMEPHGSSGDNMENDGWDFDEEEEKEAEISAVPDETPAIIPTTAITSSTVVTAVSTPGPPLASSTHNDVDADDADLIVAEDDAGWDFEDEEELAIITPSDNNVEQQPPPVATVPPLQPAPPAIAVQPVPSIVSARGMIPSPSPHKSFTAPAPSTAPSNNVPEAMALANTMVEEDICVDVGQDDADNCWDFDEVAESTVAQECLSTENRTTTMQHVPPPPVPTPPPAPTPPPPAVALPPPPVLPFNVEVADAAADDDDNDNVGDDGGGWDFDEDDLGVVEPPAAVAEPNTISVKDGVEEALNNENEQEGEEESDGGGWDFDEDI